MQKFIHYLGIAALGFISVAAIGVTLGASTMLACYLTTCGICRVQRAAIQEVRELDEESERESLPLPSQSANPNERRTLANNENLPEQTNVIIRPIENYPAR